MTPDEEIALSVARALIAAGIPAFAAPPALAADGTWDPTGGTGGSGYKLPSAWQSTVATPNWLDPTVKGWEHRAWRPGWALAAVMGHGLDLLDVDTRSDGDASRATLGAGWPTELLGAETPSGGTHTFTHSLGIASRDAVLPGIDVKAGLPDGSGRGFAFIAPTVKLSKVTGELRAYRWASAKGIPLIGRPDGSGQAIVAIVGALRAPARPSVGTGTGAPGAAWAGEVREFTPADATRFVEATALEPLRAARAAGRFNAQLNASAVVLGHFVPEFWSPTDAHELLAGVIREVWGAGPDASDLPTMASGFGKVPDWRAVRPVPSGNPFSAGYDPALVPKPAPRPKVASAARSTQAYDVAVAEPVPLPESEDPAEREATLLPEEFWAARPVLMHLRTCARAAMDSPEGVLVAALALTVAHVEPNIVLPATVGTEASINLFAALLGRSSAGKSSARKVAATALTFDQVNGLHRFSPGSGEGFAGQYQRLVKARGEAPAIERTRWRALAMVDESETLQRLNERAGSTLGSEMRKAAMGEPLGFGNVGETQTNLPEHSYRLAMLMCMQPLLAEWIMADQAGGTPQRFLWCSVFNPHLPDTEPPWPAPWRVHLPPEALAGPMSGVPGPRVAMSLPEAVTVQVKAVRRAGAREEVGALDGHSMLTRLKVAAALSLLDGRLAVDATDWELSGMLMTTSGATRDGVQRAIRTARAARFQASGKAKGAEALASDSVIEAELRRRCSERIMAKLGQGAMTRRQLWQSVTARQRDHLAEVLEALTGAGLIAESDGRWSARG